MTFEDMKKEEVRLQLVFADMVIRNRASEDLVINELKDLKAEMLTMLADY